MPTNPSTCRSLSSLQGGDVIVATITDVRESSASPTPDPDLDDVELVPVVTGDGVGAVTKDLSRMQSAGPPSPSIKPHLSLANLSLHSPSSILGTPFDSSPRFEYPFPVSGSTEGTEISLVPCMSAFTVPFGSFPTTFIPVPPPLPLSRSEVRSYSPTHPKLTTREPPVPPGLARKRWSTTTATPPRLRTRTRSSSLIAPQELVPPAQRYRGIRSGSPRATSLERSLHGAGRVFNVGGEEMAFTRDFTVEEQDMMAIDMPIAGDSFKHNKLPLQQSVLYDDKISDQVVSAMAVEGTLISADQSLSSAVTNLCTQVQ